MREDSQNARVIEYLKKHGSITQADCDAMHPKIKRLASRISDIRKMTNLLIIPEREAMYDDNGKEICHWARYRLPTEEELNVEN